MKSCLYILIALAFASQGYAITNSEMYIDLEKDTPTRKAWLTSEDSKVIRALHENKYLKTITKELKNLYDVEEILEEIKLSSGDLIQVVDFGLTKPFIIRRNGVEIFSSVSLSRKGFYQYESFSISPDEKYFGFTMYYRGNTEDMVYVIGDLEKGGVHIQKQLITDSSLFWTKGHHILVNIAQTADGNGGCFDFDAETKEFAKCSGIERLGYSPDKIAEVTIDGKDYYLDPQYNFYPSNGVIRITKVFDTKALHNNELSVSFTSRGSSGDDVVIYEAILSKELPVSRTVFTIQNQILVKAERINDYYLVQTTWGLDRFLFIYSLDGALVSKITLPKFYNIKIEGWKDPGKVLTLMVRAYENKKIVNIDLDQTELTLSDKLVSMDYGQMKISVESLLVPSFDGTMVPIQIVKDSNYKEIGVRPAFILTYGGFNIPGYLFGPSISSIRQYKPFIERGGLLILTGVRGGNEFGNAWHEAAIKEKKIKTFEDVASVAKYLIDLKLSKKEIITLFGSSNGGYVTATTGLLFPQYFGLIIPHAGVHDQLGKRRMDFNYEGWTWEYLDENIEAEKALIPAISPLELASNPVNLDFLILTGQMDTRVNPAHSYKLKASLEKSNQGKTWLYSINNNGHYETAAYYGRFAAVRDWSIIWSMALDKFDQK